MIGLALLGPAFVLATGYGVLRALGVALSPRVGARGAYAYLAGFCWLGVATFLISHVTAAPLRRVVLLPIALAPAVAGVLRALRQPRDTPESRDERTRDRERSTLLWVLPILLGALISSAMLVESLGRPVTDWDGRATWLAHARYMRSERSVDASTLRATQWVVNHPQYPPLVPLVVVVVQEIFDFPEDDRLVRPLYVLFLPVLLLVLGDRFVRRGGALAASVVVTVAAALPQFSFDRGALTACNDLPLGCFVGVSLLILTERECTRAESGVAGLLLAAAVLTKAEGAPLALLVLAASELQRRMRLRRAESGRHRGFDWVAVGMVALSLLALSSWRAGIQARFTTDYLARLTAENFSLGTPRLRPIVQTILRMMATPAEWGWFWLGVPVVLLLGWRGLAGSEARLLAAFVTLSTAIPFAAYTLGPLEVPWIVETTWNRFLVQLSIPILTIMFIAADSALGSSWRMRRVVSLVGVAVSAAVVLRLGWRLAGVRERLQVERDLNLSRCPSGLQTQAKEDESLAAAIDTPPEGAVVAGPLLVSGWAQEPAGASEICDVLIDGRRRDCVWFARVAREDVAGVLPRLGNCDLAGYQVQFAFQDGDDGRHELRVQLRSSDGRTRWLRREFKWTQR